jgi:hypothetical protein
MQFIQQKYDYLCNSPSDINEHLPTLFQYATECESILELGVRGCVSSWALVYGLLNNNRNTKKIILNDIIQCDINELLYHSTCLGIDITYEWKNDLELELKQNVDLTFIDTWHIYGQLKRELEKYGSVTNKYIIMHDTTVDEIYGENIRCGFDAVESSRNSGYSVEEINCGLGKAIYEFLNNHPEWKLREKYTNNNGLTILERI